LFIFFFFFFQAEDGIRDKLVTGVQTCALPISVEYTSTELKFASLTKISLSAWSYAAAGTGPSTTAVGKRMKKSPGNGRGWNAGRSEERRVGKECRARRETK